MKKLIIKQPVKMYENDFNRLGCKNLVITWEFCLRDWWLGFFIKPEYLLESVTMHIYFILIPTLPLHFRWQFKPRRFRKGKRK